MKTRTATAYGSVKRAIAAAQRLANRTGKQIQVLVRNPYQGLVRYSGGPRKGGTLYTGRHETRARTLRELAGQVRYLRRGGYKPLRAASYKTGEGGAILPLRESEWRTYLRNPGHVARVKGLASIQHRLLRSKQTAAVQKRLRAVQAALQRAWSPATRTPRTPGTKRGGAAWWEKRERNPTGARFISAIRKNVRAYLAGKISRSTFDRKQIALWKRADASGAGGAVRQALTPKRNPNATERRFPVSVWAHGLFGAEQVARTSTHTLAADLARTASARRDPEVFYVRNLGGGIGAGGKKIGVKWDVWQRGELKGAEGEAPRISRHEPARSAKEARKTRNPYRLRSGGEVIHEGASLKAAVKAAHRSKRPTELSYIRPALQHWPDSKRLEWKLAGYSGKHGHGKIPGRAGMLKAIRGIERNPQADYLAGYSWISRLRQAGNWQAVEQVLKEARHSAATASPEVHRFSGLSTLERSRDLLRGMEDAQKNPLPKRWRGMKAAVERRGRVGGKWPATVARITAAQRALKVERMRGLRAGWKADERRGTANPKRKHRRR